MGRSFDKSNIEEIIKTLYKSKEINDFSMDTRETHAVKVCNSCYQKCNQIISFWLMPPSPYDYAI